MLKQKNMANLRKKKEAKHFIAKFRKNNAKKNSRCAFFFSLPFFVVKLFMVTVTFVSINLKCLMTQHFTIKKSWKSNV